MSVDRLSVTVPSELGRALRSLARARGAPVSAVVTDAIAREVRLAALDVALAEADRAFGPVDAAALEQAESELGSALRGTGTRPPGP